MKINLDNMRSPCMECYIHGGRSYSPDDVGCQRCEYNIAIQLLKVVLKSNDYCTLCKNRDNLGGGYWDCNITKDFAIDWHEAFREYNIELGE